MRFLALLAALTALSACTAGLPERVNEEPPLEEKIVPVVEIDDLELELDFDGDGFTTATGDCDDADATVNPDGGEPCDGKDNNCDGITPANEWDADHDGYFLCGGDCNDFMGVINPGEDEVCDGYDNDCNEVVDDVPGGVPTWYADADGDSHGNPEVALTQCEAPPGYVADPTDCDDWNIWSSPDADEVCDGVDNDCDGAVDKEDPSYELDWDTDGMGGADCGDGTDCNDHVYAIHPGAAEICDGYDTNCDWVVPYDEGDHNWNGIADCLE